MTNNEEDFQLEAPDVESNLYLAAARLEWLQSDAVTPTSVPALRVGMCHDLEKFAANLTLKSVARARREGVAWSEIADQLGMSRQAAWERFSKLI